MRKVLLWVAAAVLAGVGLLALRAELMTVERDSVPGSRTSFVVAASTREDPQLLPEMTRGIVSVCRLLVNADLVQRSFRQTGEREFAFVLAPGLDEFDMREMRGCLQDARVQHLLVEVLEAQTAAGPSAAQGASGQGASGQGALGMSSHSTM